ncbi:MAG: aconitate hydratase AcnA [Pseudomonadota bacterium]
MPDSFSTRATLEVNGKRHTIFSLARLGERFDLTRLPYSLKILLENLLRHEDGVNVTKREIEALACWDAGAASGTEIAFMPARVLLQDLSGVPCLVDLAAMRDAIVRLGGDADSINPLVPAELVIDHSVQVDRHGTPAALDENVGIEMQRNRERYAFLRWGQKAFRNLRIVPPNTGIVHQVNLEHLARVVMTEEKDGVLFAFPDTVFGTDSHTTMVNALGVLGWGVGGIEAEAAMLGQPSSMLIPQVVGFGLHGALPEGVTVTDLVLTITQMARAHGVVAKFVEFFGDGLDHLPLADRATIANMAPEYGATCAFFAIDDEVLRYLRLSGRPDELIALAQAYAKEQGLWREPGPANTAYSSILELNLAEVRPSMAGPKRPQDRVLLQDVQQNYLTNIGPASGRQSTLRNGDVVIAAITSCTNTSNPAVMLAAGLLARKAAARGLRSRPWVKTSLAPGSLVVTGYLQQAGLMADLEQLGFYLAGYGCTTCSGNSGPLSADISQAIRDGGLTVTAVLSGNRNFEGRVHPEVKMNYLASPPLVVAYALAGTVDIDLTRDALGSGSDGKPVFLKDIWPSNREIEECIDANLDPGLFRRNYADVFKGDQRWHRITAPAGAIYRWDPASTYIRNPPYFDDMTVDPAPLDAVRGARCIGVFGDSITTDHISPVGTIGEDTPAGRYLIESGVAPADFNSYGARRGNDAVMVRATFANIRLRNLMLDGVEGGYTRHLPDGEQLSIYDAAMCYRAEGIPLIVLAGKEYGTGSSRDWAAKGVMLLGVKAVIAESFERIHRSNLVGMGVLPLQFMAGENAQTIGLTGEEVFDLASLEDGTASRIEVIATGTGGEKRFMVRVLLATPKEIEFHRHGGILKYALRKLIRRTR